MLRLLGIRHHGPGSAWAVLRALEADPPDCLLIEIPADAERSLSQEFRAWIVEEPVQEILRPEFENQDSPTSTSRALVPPVALLIYDPKDLRKAAYLPFAAFSPEWVALRFAAQHNIPIRCMDLPMELNFALDEQERENEQAALFAPEEFGKMSREERLFRLDPMGQLAQLAGYQDSERWWEATFENPDNEAAIFTAILNTITALREGVTESPRTLQREAHMRQALRQAVKDGFENIAVVCGAWHLPAFQGWKKIPASRDAALLKGIKKTKTTATWIPWSYDRLSIRSGYGAGIISPAWYELIFHHKKEAATHWMIQVARLFREEDLDVSSAHVIEAVRLSEVLATLRGLALAGIDELKEAAVTTICEGDKEKLELIENKLITGNKVGSVPSDIPAVPLQKDIEQAVKSARLTKYWGNTEEEWLGATAAAPQGGIDLREDSGRLKSYLLHRLCLLSIPWGNLVELNRHQSAGGFKEFWKLKWSPEFAIRIIEMGTWGNTVEEACVNFLKKKTEEIQTLPALTELVRDTLNAHLPSAFNFLLHKLENLAALTADIYHLMDALPPLAQIVRYGNTRGTDVVVVKQVVQHLVPRICIGLPSAVISLDEEASGEAFDKMLAVHRAIGLLNDKNYSEQWFSTLESIAGRAHVNGILRGACTRILFDKKIFSEHETAVRMQFALSAAEPPLSAAQWLEGFLQGSGLLLLHNFSLWNLLDEWVAGLSEERFEEVLPLLRRTFSRFTQPERERMLHLARQGQILLAGAYGKPDFDEERAAKVLPVVRTLLGL